MRIALTHLRLGHLVTGPKIDPLLRRVHIDVDGVAVASDGQTLVTVGPPEWWGGAVASEATALDLPAALAVAGARAAGRTSSTAEAAVEQGRVHLTVRQRGEILWEARDEALVWPWPEKWRKVVARALTERQPTICVDAERLRTALDAVLVCTGGAHSLTPVFVETWSGGLLLRAGALIAVVQGLDTQGEWLKVGGWTSRTFKLLARSSKDDNAEA